MIISCKNRCEKNSIKSFPSFILRYTCVSLTTETHEKCVRFKHNLTHFRPMFHFHTPGKCISDVSGVEMEHWAKMG